jgi:hypothetical protein
MIFGTFFQRVEQSRSGGGGGGGLKYNSLVFFSSLFRIYIFSMLRGL